nr:lasso RiPP family leader peptide-containing protein [Devosia sp. 1566]
MTKLTYTAPRLVRHGSIEAVTKGASTGSALDATFPTGTPFGDLTFS